MHKQLSPQQQTANGAPVERVSSLKYLGVHISEDLSDLTCLHPGEKA